MRLTVDGRRLPANGPSEPQMTGPVMRAIAGAKPGKQVDRLDQLGVGFASFSGTKRRAFGREEATLNVIKAIRDLDPMASDAVWNYLRLLNPGNELQAVSGEGTEEAPVGGPTQAYLDSLAERVGAEYGGGLDQLLNVLGIALLTNGAVCLEVAPTPGLNDVEDWYPVDPQLLTFKRDEDGTLQLGQTFADGVWHELPSEQVFYTPLDPDVDDPYGRPPFLSAIQPVLARAQMLNDLRAVAHQAGYPRISVEVVWDIVQAAAPPQFREPGREADFQTWAEKQLSKLVSDYTALNVDDTFVHYDWVKPTLMASSGLSFDFVALDNVLQRQLNAGLKTLPILLGINEGVSETHGSVQWQIQIAGVSALQRLIKRTVEKAATLSLQLAGFQAKARLRFSETRTVDRMFEAQAALFEGQNLKLDVDQGWRSNDEAGIERTGHEAVADPGANSAAVLQAPPPVPPGAGPDAAGGQNPSAKEKQQTQSLDPAWQLFWQMNMTQATAAPASNVSVTFPARAAVEEGAGLDGETLHEMSLKYADRARALFMAQLQALVATLVGEGWELRATTREIADSAFGLSYRREMKRLLRESIADGMRLAGDPNPVVDEKVVRRIWKQNDPFVTKLRNDLAAQVRSWSDASRRGEGPAMSDVADWFARNEYREAMMGQFLTKQGVASGFTSTRATGRTVFRWDLGPVKTEHCPDCLKRAGNVYTNDQLARIGMPGSLSLACASNCKCSLQEVRCSRASVARKPAQKRLLDFITWVDESGTVDFTQGKEDACNVVALEADAKPAKFQETLDQRRWAQPPAEADVNAFIRGRFGTVKSVQAEAQSVRAYTSSDMTNTYGVSYKTLNNRLRGREYGYVHNFQAVGDDGVMRDVYAGLDRAIEANRVSEPIVLHRGADLEDLFGKGGSSARVGSTYRDPGYLSTSVSQSGSFGGTVRLEITVPRGYPALPVNQAGTSLTAHAGEYEVILPRGTVLRIDEIVHEDMAEAVRPFSHTTIRATVVEQRPTPIPEIDLGPNPGR